MDQLLDNEGSHGLRHELDQDQTISRACFNRQLAITNGKLLGLVPETCVAGDEIFVLYGGQVLFILRPWRGSYKLVGECYIHGIMDGQALRSVRDGISAVREIRIS